MGKIVCLHGFTPEQQEEVRRLAPGWSLTFGRTGEIDPACYREAEIICGWNADAARECLESGAALRWVQTWSAGVDKLPLQDFGSRGVLVTNASGVHPEPMSETVLAMMLGLTRGLHRSIRAQAGAAWEKTGSLPEMHGKTAAVIGAGAIGREVAFLAKAFGMRMIGVRRSGRSAPGFDRVVTEDRLDDILPESDYVINILPLTAETRHLFDEGRFRLMKPTSYFINVGRGATVKTEALVSVLQSGGIAGAGLDVFEEEPLPAGHPLWKLDNIILTPHNAGATEHYKERVVALFLDNLRRYLAGEQLRNLVGYSQGY
ncbi:D-2-hydroxyacid dehydrogenase [Paenibacillus sambharensis]|uniref:D-2-hydroxyacid dehydrogenase n=1 Tax=Paenibacillus sambharensis TaxID=1803190 RepID=A0A2W1LIH4_9BACL|nr:D-2-hydroxyacid dehydrogenase [Paenibacillus sambharensis]PZD94695.1 D-2-hydroxyacid dehydrogenase [Paenibacillus sambharensis]